MGVVIGRPYLPSLHAAAARSLSRSLLHAAASTHPLRFLQEDMNILLENVPEEERTVEYRDSCFSRVMGEDGHGRLHGETLFSLKGKGWDGGLWKKISA
ncbi:hypothetical protein KSP39_PZI013265 [Platanthera zijinensis]|uniref:Uncharacterized protein n=1 Tax=Platanthera zijinensis TaxID=2320716 RepID=A0AAP0BD07_9ASPA